MISRRNFLKLAGAGTAGLCLNPPSEPASGNSSYGQAAAAPEPKIKTYRPLGKTGLEVSDIGCGAINLFNANVLRYAFDCGVNHFDTAEGYLNTNSEKMVGQALKDVRGRAIIASKYLLRTPADMNQAALIGRAEASLKRLQTDYLDIAMIHSVEGGHVLGGSLDNVQRLADRGVAYLTLAHFYENEAVAPVFPYPESVQLLGAFSGDRDLTRGLTPFGVQVIEKMLDLGIILDIAHCTPLARRQIYDLVGNRRPIIASHVGAYEVNPSPYNLQDWELKKIADNGGVAGVIFMNYWLMPHETRRGLNYIARTIRQFVQAAGIEHAGIGTDFDGFTDPPDDLPDSSQMWRLTQRLLAEGYTPEEIVKILGGNALRVLRDGWGR